nr:hypothetical protein [uncultured Flavobacterium sp.]
MMIYLKNLAVGVFLIIFGIYTIIDVNKNPDSQLKGVTIGRYMSGFGSIILGVLLTVGMVHIFSS